MNNFDFIFKYNIRNNKKKKIRLNNKQILCQINFNSFGVLVINQIIDFVNSLNNGLKRFPIVFLFYKKYKINRQTFVYNI